MDVIHGPHCGSFLGGITVKIMNLPSVSIKDLLEAGVHLGHKTFRWNPKMKQYIYGEKTLFI